jgi:hypothetical protein
MSGRSEGTESSEEHGPVVDRFRYMRSFDVRHRCSDEQSTSIHVVHISQSVAGMLQRRVLMETATVLFRIDPRLDTSPWSCLVGGLLFSPIGSAGDTDACPAQLGPPRGDLCWHRHFSNLSVRTIDSPRHKERVRANGIALRTKMTMQRRSTPCPSWLLGVSEATADRRPRLCSAPTLPKFRPSLG